MQSAPGTHDGNTRGGSEHRDGAVAGADEAAVAHLREEVSCFAEALRLDRLSGSQQVAQKERPWVHPSFADLIMRHGRMYVPAPCPGGGPQRPGSCFAAAHAWADRRGWTYVEGYALAPSCWDTPVFEHAWCLTLDGRVADPSLPDGLVTLYWGVPLTDAFRTGQDRGDDAVITFGADLRLGANTTILREGLPATAVAALH